MALLLASTDFSYSLVINPLDETGERVGAFAKGWLRKQADGSQNSMSRPHAKSLLEDEIRLLVVGALEVDGSKGSAESTRTRV